MMLSDKLSSGSGTACKQANQDRVCHICLQKVAHNQVRAHSNYTKLPAVLLKMHLKLLLQPSSKARWDNTCRPRAAVIQQRTPVSQSFQSVSCWSCSARYKRRPYILSTTRHRNWKTSLGAQRTDSHGRSIGQSQSLPPRSFPKQATTQMHFTSARAVVVGVYHRMHVALPVGLLPKPKRCQMADAKSGLVQLTKVWYT